MLIVGGQLDIGSTQGFNPRFAGMNIKSDPAEKIVRIGECQCHLVVLTCLLDGRFDTYHAVVDREFAV